MANVSEFVAEKRISKGALSKNEKILIINVFNALRHQNSTFGVTRIVEMCSNITGVGQTTIYRVVHEDKCGPIRSPKRITGRKATIINDDEKSAISGIIHSFFLKKEMVTLDKIMHEMKKYDSIPPMGKYKVWKTLKEMNFRYENGQWIAKNGEGATFTSQTSSLQASTSSTSSTNTLPISEEDIKIEIEEEKLFDPSSREYIEYPNTAKKARIEDDNTNVPTICPIKQEIEGATQDLVEAIEVKKEPGDDEPDVGHYLPVAQIKMEIGDKFVE